MLIPRAWYVAAWSHEVVAGAPFSRKVCDLDIVLFRSGGGVSALLDMCPHRFAPLSAGVIVEDNIQCPYHGLQFNGSGLCVHNPHGRIPIDARVWAFPVVERHGLTWIWLDEHDEADVSLIPDFSCLTDVSARATRGVFTIGANYELVADNLLDLSHVAFLHQGGIGSDALTRGSHKVLQRDTTVFSNRWCPNDLPTPVWGALSGYAGKLVDHWLEMRWDPPGHMLLDVGVTLAGRPREEGYATLSTNILTPETAHSTHYFFGGSRNFARDDPAMDEAFRQAIKQAFLNEDRPMLEAVQRRMGDRDLNAMKPLLLGIDAGALRARRLLEGVRQRKQRIERPWAHWEDQASGQPAAEFPPIVELLQRREPRQKLVVI